MNHPRLIWVIGGSGFIGSNLVEKLLGQQDRVLIFDSVQPGFQTKADFIKVDLAQAENARVIFAHQFKKQCPDDIYFAAGYGINPSNSSNLDLAFAINAKAPNDLYEAASNMQVKNFVYLGSCFEYGSLPGKIAESALPQPTSVYGVSKLAGTLLLKAASSAAKTRLIIPRLFGQWGPKEPPYRLVPGLLRSIKARQKFPMTKGEQIRDYLYVKDTVAILVELVKSKIPSGTIVNVGSGSEITLSSFVKQFSSALNADDLLQIGELPYRDQEMMSLVADISVLKSWIVMPKLTTIQSGIREML